MMEKLEAISLFLALLNPFLLIIYLLDVVHKQTLARFRMTLAVAGVIAMAVFLPFILVGDIIFSKLFGVHFESFQIFGGVVFLLIGLDFVFKGPAGIEMLRGDNEQLASSIAMPILIGPGTVSAAVLIGERFPPWTGVILVASAIAISLTIMVIMKWFFDRIQQKREDLLERYAEIAGKILALYAGTVAVEMIMTGFTRWLQGLV